MLDGWQLCSLLLKFFLAGVCDGVVLDLSLLRSVTINPRTKIAIVDGGALWQDVDQESQVHCDCKFCLTSVV
jgi:hypothetical protein